LKDRQKALAELEATTHTLVQVNIVNEGFDLPDLAMLIDARPTMSPGLFLQMFGRLTRPSNVRKRYICLCRNLERFAFLLEGILPSTVVYEAQQAFQTAGIYGSFYLVSHFDSATAKKTMYAVVLQPEKKEPTVFERHDRKVNIDPNNPWKGGYGKWRLSDGVPDDFKGFATEKKREEISPAQLKTWEKNATRLGLEVTRKPDPREIQMLFILRDTGVRV